MLGDLIYQHTGKITSIRVLDNEKSKMEATVIASGKLKDVGNVKYYYYLLEYSKSRWDIKDSGNEMAADSAKVREYGVGKYSSGRQHHQQTVWIGSAFYQSTSSSDGKFSFLNNTVGVFETEVDNDSGNVIQKVWEWK